MRILSFLLCISLAGITPAGAHDPLPVTHRFFNNFEDRSINVQWMNPNSVRKDSTGENHFSMTDSTFPYSSGIETELPEDLRRKNIRITISASVRSWGTPFHCQLVISVARADSMVAWKGFSIPDSICVNASWSRFNCSSLFPMSIPPDSRIKIYLWNDGGKSRIDLDEFEILFTEEKFPSFWPASTE